MFCTQCGAANLDDARFCKNCSTPVRSQAAPAQFIATRAAKSPGIAAVLSFFICGLGQIYNGQISKGLIMMFTYLVSWMLMLVIIGFFTTPILWIWGMIDAYRSAERINLDATISPF